MSELLRAGAKTPRALTAMAARHRQQGEAWAPVFERIAIAVREGGQSLFEAVRAERKFFTPRFVATLALANLSGQLFRLFVQRLREYVDAYRSASPSPTLDFPLMQNEIREFCFFFGHLVLERASQPEMQTWLPQIFTAKLRLPVTLLLGRFFDQGILLSAALARTPPFNDPEMILAVRVGEELNQVGRELLALGDWLVERDRLEERLRWVEWILPTSLPPSPTDRAESSGDS